MPPASSEQSPWAAYFFRLPVPSERARRHPHGFLVHGYARPGEPHTPEGWRFSDTVIETWDECLRHFPAYRDKPVIVSEWNCPTGGLTTADQYRPGGLAGDAHCIPANSTEFAPRHSACSWDGPTTRGPTTAFWIRAGAVSGCGPITTI